MEWLKENRVENFTSYLNPFHSRLESDDKALGSNKILSFFPPPHCHRHLYFVSMKKKNLLRSFPLWLITENESHSGFVHVLKVYAHTFPLFEKIKLSEKLIASLTF